MPFKNIFNKHRDKFNSHVRKEIQERLNTGKAFSLAEYKKYDYNSYELKRLIPLFDDETFLWHLEYCLKCRSHKLNIYELSEHYDDYLMTDGIDELLLRFKKLRIGELSNERNRFRNNKNYRRTRKRNKRRLLSRHSLYDKD